MDKLINNLSYIFDFSFTVFNNIAICIKSVWILIVKSVHDKFDLHIGSTLIDTLLLYQIPPIREFNKFRGFCGLRGKDATAAGPSARKYSLEAARWAVPRSKDATALTVFPYKYSLP